MTKNHEKKVEKFYNKNHKSTIKKIQNKGYLNFGIWETGKETYEDAAKKLLNYVLDKSKMENDKSIINSACGYGTETFEIFNRFKPKRLIGIDITKIHIDYANKKAIELKLDKKIKFYQFDAKKINEITLTEPVDYIISIEGSPHFNTREDFLKASYDTLKANGEIILTDIICGKNEQLFIGINRILSYIVWRLWLVPKANKINENTYKKLLTSLGFEIIDFEVIGNKVFPGYSNHYNYDKKTFRETFKRMGFFNTVGLIIINKFLGYGYKVGGIEYIYVRAKKNKKI